MHYSLLAGERALTAYAWEEARSYFQRGLGAKEGQPIDGKTAELLFGLGRAQCSIGQQEEAMDSLRRSFDHYVEVGDVHQAATVAACPAPHLPGQLRGSTQLIDRALALVPPDSLDVGHLLSVQCTALGIDQGDYDGGLQAFAQSLAIAQREKDEKLEMQTLARGCSVEAYHLRFEESLQKGRKVIELANQIDDPVCEVTSRFFTAHSLWTKGDLEEARLQAGG